MNFNKWLFVSTLFIALAVSSSHIYACNCPIFATASGSDIPGTTASITDFSCAQGNITSAFLSFNLQGTNCPSWTSANVIVNGNVIATGLCSADNLDLSPYFPLTSVSVSAVDNPADGVSDNVTVNMYLGLNGAQATFGFTAPNYICYGQPVQFNNQTQCAANYSWDFGDGQQSNLEQPSHIYSEAGYYYVNMMAFDASGSYMGNYSQPVFVAGHKPFFNLSEDTVCVGDQIQIWDAGFFQNNANVTYTINYGDGNQEVINNSWASFNHSYATAGDFTTTLTIESDCGVQIIDTIIHVGNNLPVSGFIDVYAGNGGAICPGTQVNLYTNWDLDYLFNYGDGLTGTAGNHIYPSFGTYIPSVTLQNGCGNTATYIGNPIIVTNVPNYSGNAYIGANINNINNQACPGTSVGFSTANASSYSWNFGDGGTSNVRYPSHIFTNPGTYNVGVTLIDGCGNDTTLTMTVQIVTNLPINPNVAITSDVPSEICIGDGFQYNVSSAYQYENSGTFLWNFGDGTFSDSRDGFHSYSSAGTYLVSCTITNSCGNDTTLFTQIAAGTNIPPQFIYAGTPQEIYCPGDNVPLVAAPYNAASTLVWDMGNGTTIASQDSLVLNIEGTMVVYHLANYSYSSPGIYNVQATITNGCGLSATEQFVLTVGPGAEIENAGFFIDFDEYVCLGEPVVFRGYGGNEFFWNFGDNSGIELSSAALEPVEHSYNTPGSYIVTMIAFNNCGDTAMFTQQIIIPDSDMEIITNSLDASCLQADGQAIANVIGPNPPYSYSWTSGDNTNIASDLEAGIYVVTVTDNKGCSDFAIATISDAEAPTLAVTNVIDVSCFGEDNGAIDITPIGNTSGIQYLWSNGATTEDVNGLVAGPYEVIATNGQGCIAVASILVEQPGEVSVAFTSNNATCNLSNGSATAVVNGTTGPYTFIWSNGQSGPNATGLAAGIYAVSVIDNQSCLTTANVAISETNSPGIIMDSILNIGCGEGGSAIYITPIGGASPYTYVWSTGATSQDLTGLSPGEYSVSVTGANGCEGLELFEIEYENPLPNPICVVTVTPSQHNKVAWEKVATLGIDHYNVYKESSSAGLYYLLGTVPYDSLSIYIDTISNPAVQAYRYKISAVDSCGTESYISPQHKTIHLTQNIGVSQEVNLIWDNYAGFSYTTYNVLRYDDLAGWTMLTSLPSNVNSYSDLNAPLGTATSLYYVIEVPLEAPCVSTTMHVENNNTTRSNRTEAIAGDITDGISELTWVNSLSVYPNPSTGLFQINLFAGDVNQATFQVIDAQGRIVREHQEGYMYHGKELEMDLTDLTTGIYLLKVEFDGNLITKRIVIQK